MSTLTIIAWIFLGLVVFVLINFYLFIILFMVNYTITRAKLDAKKNHKERKK